MLTTIKLYVDIGVAVLVLCLVGFAGWEYDQRKLDADKLDKLGDTLTATQGALTQLQEGQRADTAAIQAVAASAAQVAQHGSVVRQRVATMEASDAKIHDVLSMVLPVGGCMLDDTCGGAAAHGATLASSAATVH